MVYGFGSRFSHWFIVISSATYNHNLKLNQLLQTINQLLKFGVWPSG